jgi:hypothetical protein
MVKCPFCKTKIFSLEFKTIDGISTKRVNKDGDIKIQNIIELPNRIQDGYHCLQDGYHCPNCGEILEWNRKDAVKFLNKSKLEEKVDGY